MKTAFITSAIFITLLGWLLLYEWHPFFLTDDLSWYILDNTEAAATFLLSLQWIAFWKHLTESERYVGGFASAYFGMELLGEMLDINQHGNYFPYFTGSVLIITCIAII